MGRVQVLFVCLLGCMCVGEGGQCCGIGSPKANSSVSLRCLYMGGKDEEGIDILPKIYWVAI